MRIPSVSGKTSVLILALCFALTAVLVPMASHLDRWIEDEIVLTVWWLVWVVALSRFLYTGRQIRDDHVFTGPRSWLPNWKGKTHSGLSSGDSSALGCLDLLSGGADLEGCAVVLAVIVGAILLFAAAWLLIEVAFPVLALVVYFLIRGMLAHVVNDWHKCKGHVLRSLAWGAVWATAYTVPLGLLVYLVHVIYSGAIPS